MSIYSAGRRELPSDGTCSIASLELGACRDHHGSATADRGTLDGLGAGPCSVTASVADGGGPAV